MNSPLPLRDGAYRLVCTVGCLHRLWRNCNASWAWLDFSLHMFLISVYMAFLLLRSVCFSITVLLHGCLGRLSLPTYVFNDLFMRFLLVSQLGTLGFGLWELWTATLELGGWWAEQKWCLGFGWA